MKKWLKNNWQLFIFLFLGLILFWKPLFSNLPLGLDSVGHLTKISYLKEFGFVNWDLGWYSGTLFLKLYPPLFYYLVFLFPSKIVPFGSNLICFLSLIFTSFGIYLLLNFLTKNKRLSLFFGLSFFTVLSLSYYWIATANLPYFSALWTIPFSLYFLERFLEKKEKKFFLYFVFLLSIALLMHILTGLIIGFFMVLRFLFEGINKKNLRNILLFGGFPVLLTSFWVLPFFAFSNSSIGYEGYVPKLIRVFGFGDFISWGVKAGGIGIVSFIFIFCLIFFFKNFKKNKAIENFYFFTSLFLGFLLLGGLGKYYPYGVDPVRFILIFSIMSIIFSGIVIHKNKLYKNKILVFIFGILLISGLIWNSSIIKENFERYNYTGKDSRYGIFLEMVEEGFPVENNFSNYRFGTQRYLYSSNLNYFFPSASQTFGYQDVGMLNEPRYYDFRWHLWTSEDIEDSIYWLDWFGIKYFEGSFEELNKFENDSRFKLYDSFELPGYEFVLYEYLEAKPIISLVDNLEEDSLGNVKNFSFERSSPDEIFIYYDNLDSDDVVVFKEFYFKNWKSKDIKSGKKLEVYEVGPGFMAVYPSVNSEGIKLYYQKSFVEYFGIFLSLFSLILLFLIFRSKSELNTPLQKS